MLKKLILKIALNAITEAIDDYVASTADKTDDQVWAAIKLKIAQYLEARL